MTTTSLNNPIYRSSRFSPGEISLASGLGCLALAIALFYFVMGIFFAAIPAIITIQQLVAGILRTRDKDRLVWCQLGGALLLIIGMWVLLMVAFKSCGLSYEIALHKYRPTSPAPTTQQWFSILLQWFLPVLFIFPGVSLWTNWSMRRRGFWCAAVVAVSPLVIVFHQILSALGFPLTA